MWFSEDVLKVINSALALGDPVLPPVGTELVFDDDGIWEVMGYRKNIYTYHGGYLVMLECFHGTSRGHTSNYRVPSDYVPTVIYVPIECPPFEEWERVDV